MLLSMSMLIFLLMPLWSLNAFTYRHLTKGLVEADKISDAMNLLREMLNKGHGTDSLVYNNIISGFLELERNEAMSNVEYLDSNMIVILNDSRHSLHPKLEEGSKTTISVLSTTLSKLQSSKSFRKFREVAKVVHDVDRQRVPVRFAISSAGLVGSDGPMLGGAFYITFMSCLPNMIVMAPADEVELVNMVVTTTHVDDRPICFHYPRGVVGGMNNFLCNGNTLGAHDTGSTGCQIGKGRVLVEGKDVAFLGYGVMVQNCLRARSILASLGIYVTIADARFCKPLDIKLFIELDGQLDGKIKIEYASKATDNSGTVIGIKCKDGIVMSVAGLAADGRQIVVRTKSEATNYERLTS
ncbi:hypothetical protein IFM89_004307 [Coptis chinensis]|uniref:1-deoxy-D-xylulose-5-phosphate synthase n=1 Tax=Coptis chinensis TaxID=261450 RepID=A0A835I8R5_9MAGN|nr:hypothetical protein IFM89_004307 [Coptis chinensis]